MFGEKQHAHLSQQARELWRSRRYVGRNAGAGIRLGNQRGVGEPRATQALLEAPRNVRVVWYGESHLYLRQAT